MRKFGRRQILTVLTTAAIVVTTAFSFAAWDQTTATVAGSVTVERVSMEGGSATYDTSSTGLVTGNSIEYAGDAAFVVTDSAGKAKKLEITPVIKNAETILIKGTDYDITISKDSTPLVGIEGKFTDTLETSNGNHTYKVKLTLKDTANVKDGANVSVELKGTLL